MSAGFSDISGFDAIDAPSKKLWTAAAVLALTFHLGCGAFAIVKMQQEDDADDLGAPGLQISLELAAPRLDPTDLPPGPDTEASAASTAVTEQKAMLKETELPKDTPTETDDPDRLVTLNNSKNKQEEDPKVAATRQTASTESVASEATAMPTSETLAESAQSTTLDQGTGQSKQRVRTTWQKELSAHLDRHKRNPAVPKFKNVKVVVDVTFDRLGHVVTSTIAQSSGDAAYDEAALAMVRRSDPVPPPPPLVADEGLTFALPVVFRVKS